MTEIIRVSVDDNGVLTFVVHGSQLSVQEYGMAIADVARQVAMMFAKDRNMAHQHMLQLLMLGFCQGLDQTTPDIPINRLQ